ncbi:6194_t:CDS:1, partial [Diversispora eburnea]
MTNSSSSNDIPNIEISIPTEVSKETSPETCISTISSISSSQISNLEDIVNENDVFDGFSDFNSDD